MFSGKTAKLVEEYGDGKGVLAFRPDIDKRYGDEARIYSKIKGINCPAVLISYKDPGVILRIVNESKQEIQRIIVDEVSFFEITVFLKVVEQLTERGVRIVVGGLDYDANRIPWGPTLALTGIPGVEEIVLTSRCDGEEGLCPEEAIWSYRKVANQKRLVVKGEEMYGAACEKHYLELHHKPRGKK